ncbi:MAG: winged helix-turn-helix domain-containing protein [Candidatus Nanohaloarchaea archaeon]
MLWWLIGGTRGGKNRLRIIMALEDKPMNANKIAEDLDLDYKTVRHHLDLMEEHNVIDTMGQGYGKNYFLTDQMEQNLSKLEEIKEQAGVEI